MSEARPVRRRRGRTPLIMVGVIVLALVLAAVSYGLVINNSLTSNLNRGASMPPPPSGTVPNEPSDQPAEQGDPADPKPDTSGPVNIVLMGSDTRGDDQGRSDALMVLHLSADRRSAYIISFPRDMWVDIPGHGRAKINAAYAWGGTALTVQTLQDMLEVQMHHLALIDFQGFIGLTENLGGVTVVNDHEFTARGYHFPKGEITIAGEEALVFVRERMALPRGDFDRAENQRNVVKAIIAKGLSPEVIANPSKFTSFVAGVARYTTVDNGMTDARIRGLALSLRLGPSGIKTIQAPISGLGTSADGQSIDIVDEARLAELAQALKDDDMASYVAKYPEG